MGVGKVVAVGNWGGVGVAVGLDTGDGDGVEGTVGVAVWLPFGMAVGLLEETEVGVGAAMAVEVGMANAGVPVAVGLTGVGDEIIELGTVVGVGDEEIEAGVGVGSSVGSIWGDTRVLVGLTPPPATIDPSLSLGGVGVVDARISIV